VICSNILDVPSGWYPRENGRRIYRCKVI
jgi:hypothetical protein